MWTFVRDAALWAYNERAWLGPLLKKYAAPGRPAPRFDGPALKALVLTWEPYVWMWWQGVPKARILASIIRDKFGPHRMTPAEERAWMDRFGSPG